MWLKFATADLLASDRLRDNEQLVNISCFHSQQCVEKCLKAILEFQGIIPPKTHDLIRLYGMCDIPFDVEEDMLAHLNEIYIDSRYPATIGLLPKGYPSVEEAGTFYYFARDFHRRTTATLTL
jgi:HEPN domain-containing protein